MNTVKWFGNCILMLAHIWETPPLSYPRTNGFFAVKNFKELVEDSVVIPLFSQWCIQPIATEEGIYTS